MKILDLSAGRRAIWFDRDNPLATFVDKRAEVCPTIVADTTALPPEVGTDFDLVVFDPPHLNYGKNSNMSKSYGHHTTAQILATIAGTSKEAHRVTRPNALMALKWNDHDISLKRVLELMPEWEPLFGQKTTARPRANTTWALLRRRTPAPSLPASGAGEGT